jgi:hypothetical protein
MVLRREVVTSIPQKAIEVSALAVETPGQEGPEVFERWCVVSLVEAGKNRRIKSQLGGKLVISAFIQ